MARLSNTDDEWARIVSGQSPYTDEVRAKITGGRFRYTDEQWAKIAHELPPGAATKKLRWSLEGDIGDGIGTKASQPRARKKFIRDCREVYSGAQKLYGSLQDLLGAATHSANLEPLRNAGIWPDMPGMEPVKVDLIDFLQTLPKIARTADELHAHLTRRGRAPRDFRDQLIFCFTIEWVKAGGELKASNAFNGAKDGGPLIRFLLAASEPAVKLSADAARNIVRKLIKERWSNELRALVIRLGDKSGGQPP